MKDPLKQQLLKDIHDYRNEKKTRAPNENKNIGRKILYLFIGMSIIASLIRIAVALITR